MIDGFYRACEKYPDSTALIYLGEKFTYRELKEYIQRFATALHDLGVRKDDKIMLYIPNSPQFLIAYLGAQLIGGVPVPVSPIYTPTEIRYLINDCQAKTVVCLDTNFRYVKEIFHETGLERIIVTTYVEMLPVYKKVLGFLLDKVPTGAIETGENIYRFGKLLSRTRPIRQGWISIRREQLCYILYTGGTTGFPKGCIATHSGMVSFINEIREFGEGHIREGEDTLIMVNPLFHQLAQGMILGMVLYKGNTAVLMPIPEVDAILDRSRGTGSPFSSERRPCIA